MRHQRRALWRLVTGSTPGGGARRPAALVLGALAALSLAVPASAGKPPNVLLVVLDTARADAVSRSVGPDSPTPTFARLAQSGVTYSNARSTAPWTLPSHASLFTGLYPSRHGAHHEHLQLDQERVTLAEILSSTHETAGFTENPQITIARGFAQGFGTYDETWRARSGIQQVMPTVSRVVEWLGRRDSDRPFFLFVNLMSPHLPYFPPEGSEKRFLPAGTPADQVMRLRFVNEREARLYIMGKLPLGPGDFAVLRALYQAEVAHADAQLGQIIAALEASGSLDRTLVIVVSDHGENLGEHGLMEHQLCIYETLLHVPMLLRLPGKFEIGRASCRERVYLRV